MSGDDLRMCYTKASREDEVRNFNHNPSGRCNFCLSLCCLRSEDILSIFALAPRARTKIACVAIEAITEIEAWWSKGSEAFIYM